jgi:threonine dehydratase
MLTVDDVRAAATRLAAAAARTPLLTCPALDASLGTRVVCKAENMQNTGSFKFRGAYHHLATLAPAERARGVVGASSGNHAHALAAAAVMFGIRATAVVPADAPAVKLEAIARHGADLVTYDRVRDDRDAVVTQLAEARGLTVVPSANSVAVMAGAGTVAAEILDEAPDVDTLLVPVGGGGLAAGCATLAKAAASGIRVIGVEPVTGDDTRRSLRRGLRVSIDPPATAADGLAHTTPAPLPFSVNARLLDEVVTVSDDAIAEAMTLCFTHLKIVVEPSGATALAALTAGQVRPGSGRMAVVISGGNVDWTRFRALISRRTIRGLPGLRASTEHATDEPPLPGAS